MAAETGGWRRASSRSVILKAVNRGVALLACPRHEVRVQVARRPEGDGVQDGDGAAAHVPHIHDARVVARADGRPLGARYTLANNVHLNVLELPDETNCVQQPPLSQQLGMADARTAARDALHVLGERLWLHAAEAALQHGREWHLATAVPVEKTRLQRAGFVAPIEAVVDLQVGVRQCGVVYLRCHVVLREREELRALAAFFLEAPQEGDGALFWREESARHVRHKVDQLVDLSITRGPELCASRRRNGGRRRGGDASGVEALREDVPVRAERAALVRCADARQASHQRKVVLVCTLIAPAGRAAAATEAAEAAGA
eukprot:scaffold56005_cov74-Phaeocystis_antarctica.AAC.5